MVTFSYYNSSLRLVYFTVLWWQKVKRPYMKRDLSNVCLLSCPLCYTYTHYGKQSRCWSWQGKFQSSKLPRKVHCLWRGWSFWAQLCISVYCTTGRGGADQNRIIIDVGWGDFRIFDFLCLVVNINLLGWTWNPKLLRRTFSTINDI